MLKEEETRKHTLEKNFIRFNAFYCVNNKIPKSGQQKTRFNTFKKRDADKNALKRMFFSVLRR